MSVLLWKEFRENVYKVATGLGVVLLLHILRQIEGFNASFAGDLNGWAAVIGCLTAGVLGMDVIAGERSRNTLEFLFVRPTTVGRILAAKFAIGAFGLFVVTAAFWAMVYATALIETPSPWEGKYVSQAVADIPWLAMVYAWYLPTLVVYTTVFLASCTTENPAEAAGAGGIVALLAILFIMLVAQVYPGSHFERSVIQDLINVVFSRAGDLVRLATRGDAVLHRSLLAGGLVAAGFAAAWAAVSRFRDFTLGRRSLVIAGFVLVTLLMTLPRLLPDNTSKILPLASVRVGERARDIELVAERAFLLFDDSLMVVDVSHAASPKVVTTVRTDPAWSLSRMARIGTHLCAGGWREAMPADSAGVVCFDISIPDAPRLGGIAMLVSDYDRGDPDGGFEMGRQVIDVGDVAGTLLVPNVTEGQSELIALRLDETGAPHVVDVLVLETYDYPHEVWEGNRRYPRARFVSRHGFDVVPGQDRVYLGLRSGLSIVEVKATGALHELSRTDLGDVLESTSGRARGIAVREDRLFVRRQWPNETVEFDVSDAAHPRQIRTLYRSTMETWPRQEGYIYRPWGTTIQLYDPADPHRRPVPALGLALDNPRRGVRSRPILRDGLAYAIIDGELAIFELPVLP